jgi:hypothetical protein
VLIAAAFARDSLRTINSVLLAANCFSGVDSNRIEGTYPLNNLVRWDTYGYVPQQVVQFFIIVAGKKNVRWL